MESKAKDKAAMRRTDALVGWAQTDITPSQPAMLWGQFHTRVSRGVLDPLTATALAIEADSDMVIIVSCDLVFVTASLVALVRKQIAGRAPGFDPAKLFLCATHTHTAPVFVEGIYGAPEAGVMAPSAYEEYLSERVAGAAVQAWAQRKPGAVAWALSHAVLGRNRRTTYADGHAVMYGATVADDFDGFEDGDDHRVQLLVTWDEHNNPTGVIVNLACPAQLSEQSYYLSADFWHEARTEIRRRLARDIFVLAQCAAAGDQSPHVLIGKPAEDRMLKLAGLGTAAQARLAAAGLEDPDADCRLARRELFGQRIADAVCGALSLAARDIRRGIPFAHRVKTLRLPVRMVTDAKKEQAAQALAHYQATPADSLTHHRRIVRAEGLIARHARQQPSDGLEIEAHFLRIGDVAMVTNPFELFMHYGQQMTARSPAAQTFVVQLAGCALLGEMAKQLGGLYLPTARGVRGGSYSANADDNFVGPEGGQVLVEETVSTLKTLWSE